MSKTLLHSNDAALAEQHLDALALGWQRRHVQRTSHAVSFHTLHDLDLRLQARISALLHLGPTTGRLAEVRLQEPLLRGEMFALMLLALQGGHASVQRTCLAMVQAVPRMREPTAAALEWVSPAVAHTFARALPSAQPLGEWLHLRVLSAHPELKDGRAYSAQHLAAPAESFVLHARLRHARYSHAPAFADLARAQLNADAPALQADAARALLVHPARTRSDVTRALQTLQTLATSMHPCARRAAFTLASLSPPAATPVLAALERMGRRRLLLEMLGWCGTPDAVPALAQWLDDPDHGRIAAASLALLTGSLPPRDGWQAEPANAAPTSQRRPPPDSDALDTVDPDAALPWPDRRRFETWWARHAGRLIPGKYHLAGQPCEVPALLHTLGHGQLAWRYIAALRLQAWHGVPGMRLSQPAHAQRAHLAQLQQQVAARSRTDSSHPKRTP